MEIFQLPKSVKNIAIFDDFDYPKIPTLQPSIGSPNGMHRNDAGAMTNCSMWFLTGSELSIENDIWKYVAIGPGHFLMYKGKSKNSSCPKVLKHSDF